MIHAEKIRAIQADLDKGATYRCTARIHGVSRETVRNIARGKITAEARQIGEHERDERPRPIGRCPTCGAKVALPCLACDLEALATTARARHPRYDEPREPLEATGRTTEAIERERHETHVVPTHEEHRTAAWPDNDDGACQETNERTNP